jgi:LacI family transcriptional regulator
VGDRASIRDVAAAANVSIKTVSRVINGVDTVERELRDRVRNAIVELNYVPNTMARSLKTGAGNAIGVVVDSIDDVFFSSLVSAVEKRAIEFGLGVVVGSTGFDPARERDQLLRLASQHVRGVILAPVSEELTFLEPYRTSMPVVTVDRSLPGFDSVTVDDYAAAGGGVERLVAAGHRRIGLIGFDRRFQTARRRREAYAAVLVEHGIPVDEALVPEVPLGSSAARSALRALLALPEPPTALFLANARHASAVVSEMHRLGCTNLATVSFGDFSLADAVEPTISCIDQDPYSMGALAFDRLTQLFDNPDVETTDLKVPTGFVERSSHLIRDVDAAAQPNRERAAVRTR